MREIHNSSTNTIYTIYVYLPNALHSVGLCLNRLSYVLKGVRIYNGANSSRDIEGVPKF